VYAIGAPYGIVGTKAGSKAQETVRKEAIVGVEKKDQRGASERHAIVTRCRDTAVYISLYHGDRVDSQEVANDVQRSIRRAIVNNDNFDHESA
jgi:hypothetical protein